MSRAILCVHTLLFGAVGCLGLYEISQDPSSVRVIFGTILLVAGVRVSHAPDAWKIRSEALMFTFILGQASRFTVQIPGITIAESTYHVRIACLLVGLSCLLFSFEKSERPKEPLVPFILGVGLSVAAIGFLMRLWLAQHYRPDSGAFWSTILNTVTVCAGVYVWFKFRQLVTVGRSQLLSPAFPEVRHNVTGDNAGVE